MSPVKPVRPVSRRAPWRARVAAAAPWLALGVSAAVLLLAVVAGSGLDRLEPMAAVGRGMGSVLVLVLALPALVLSVLAVALRTRTAASAGLGALAGLLVGLAGFGAAMVWFPLGPVVAVAGGLVVLAAELRRRQRAPDTGRGADRAAPSGSSATRERDAPAR